MRAAIYEQLGAADEVMRVVDLPRPEPGPGEVLVKVHVSGVNPTDWKVRTGLRGGEMAYDWIVPNQDGAGVVEAVGQGVDPARVGERVWLYFSQYGRQQGAAAEWIALPAERAVPLPGDTSFDLGAMMGIPALTAHRCLFADGPLDGSCWVLVAGGAGAVGHFAIELAKRAGARVIATVSSPEKAAIAQAAGADVVINYREADTEQEIRAAAPSGVDRVVEVAPSANLALDLSVVKKPGAAIAIYASDAAELSTPIFPVMQANVAIRGVYLYEISWEALQQGIADVNAALAEGALTPLPVHRFPLEQIAAAHQASEQGAVGKVLVDL